MSSGIDVPMNDRAKELNAPCRFYKGQAGAGGWLRAYGLARSQKDAGPYDGIDAREEELRAARTTWATAAAEGQELPIEQQPFKGARTKK
jgi:hypothetical protein